MARYYRIALIDSITYQKDNRSWERFEALKLAGHGVEVLDPANYPGLLKKDGTVNEAMLEPFKRTFNPDYIATGNESAEDILTALEQTTLGQAEPPKHFVVFGYVGKDNFGDELIFKIICDQVRRRYPGAFVTLVGHDPAASLKRHGVAAVTPLMKAQIDTALNGAAALIFMAGIMFDEPFVQWTAGKIDLFLNPHSELAGQTALTLLANMNDTPVVYLGIGAGPLAHPDSKKIVKLASLTQPHFVTRDSRTTDLLLKAGVDGSLVETKADLAFLSELPGYSSEAALKLGRLNLDLKQCAAVALRRCTGMPATFDQAVAATLDYAVKRYALTPIFLDFAPEDEEIHDRVISLMQHGNTAVRLGLASDFDEAILLLASVRLAFAMRLHCSIIANCFNVPSIGFDYLDKVGAFYRQMGRESSLLGLDFTDTQGRQVLDAVMAHERQEKELLRAHAETNRALAQEALDILWQAVSDGESAPRPQQRYYRVESVDARSAAQLKAKLAAAEKEKSQLKKRLKQLKNSSTWKAGHAVTAIPRAIKRALSSSK